MTEIHSNDAILCRSSVLGKPIPQLWSAKSALAAVVKPQLILCF